MTQADNRKILRLDEPGVVVELDRRTADELGAFEEDALDETDALESAETERRDVHRWPASRTRFPIASRSPPSSSGD